MRFSPAYVATTIAMLSALVGCRARGESPAPTSTPLSNGTPPFKISGVDGEVVAARATGTPTSLVVDGDRIVWSDEYGPQLQTLSAAPVHGGDPREILSVPFISGDLASLQPNGIVMRTSQTGREDYAVQTVDTAGKGAPATVSATGAIDFAVDGDTIYAAFEHRLERRQPGDVAMKTMFELAVSPWQLAAGEGNVAWLADDALMFSVGGKPPAALVHGLARRDFDFELVVDATHAYYLTQIEGRTTVWSVPAAGGAPTKLAAPDAEIMGLRLVRGALYWFERPANTGSRWVRIQKLLVAGQSPATPGTIVHDPDMAAASAFDASHVYWDSASCGPGQKSCIRRAAR